MMRLLAAAVLFAGLFTLPHEAAAQFRGRDDDSDRRRGDDDDRGDRGDRGGFDWRSRFGGGDGGSPDWSRFRRGGEEGGDRGGDSGRSGFGPPGGFGGGFGPPGGFGGGFGPPGGFGGGFGPPGGFGGSSGGRPSPDFFFDRLDRDRDGKLNGEEIEGAGFFRGMLDRAGVKEGASKEDFSKGFERMQEERSRGEGGDRDSRSREPSYYVPKKKERVTVDLPDDYRGMDVDGDQQIGLYEWREWDRGSIDDFFARDRNGDGFLTPKEIAAGPGESSDDRDESRTEVADSRPARPQSPAPASSPSPTTPVATIDEAAESQKGKAYFSAVDANHDGKATPDELARLKKLRPVFDKAGVSLDREMTQDEFIAGYLRGLRS